MFQCKLLKCSYFTSICIPGWGANILNQTTDMRSLASVRYCQTQLSLKVSRPDIWHEVKQIVSLFLWLETRHTDGKNWWEGLAVFDLDNSSQWEGSHRKFCLNDVWKSGLLHLPEQPTYLNLTGVQIHKPNIFALASLESYQSTLHQKYEVRTKKQLSILKPAVNLGLWKCQRKN